MTGGISETFVGTDGVSLGSWGRVVKHYKPPISIVNSLREGNEYLDGVNPLDPLTGREFSPFTAHSGVFARRVFGNNGGHEKANE